jgi:membrane dipeptidase
MHMASANPPVFDGHNDTVLSIARTGRSFFERSVPNTSVYGGGDGGHLDLPRARAGGFGGGFFAVYVPNPPDGQGPMSLTYAQANALGSLATLREIADESDGEVAVVTTAEQIEACLGNGTIAMLLHLEGAEPIDAEGRALEVYYAAGLRSVGLTHSRANIFGHGVHGQFPSSPDTGPGLTDAGKNLVRLCNELGVVIDLSHLNEKGFWDVAQLSEDPLVATHSNSHALTPHPRNLTVEQLDAVRDSNGIVGLNFAVSFLREDGGRDADTPVSRMVDHIDYLADTVGIDRVALGSDFDGTTVPRAIGDAAGLPVLFEVLRQRGYDETALEKIAWRNWVRVLRATWGE